MWKWYNYSEARCGQGKRLLRVNVDETSICQWLQATCGNVMKGVTTRAGSVQPRAKVARGNMRRYLTYAAFVCDEQSLQPCMPQVVIANEGALRVGDLAALKQRAEANQVVWREKSAWMTNALFRKCIDLMLTLLGPVEVTQRHIVLFFDAARAHTHEAVLRHCTRKGLQVVLIPAKSTSLLQPLDTHVFSQLKHMLRKRYCAAQLLARRTVLPVAVVVMLVWATGKTVLEEQSWRHAFCENGFGDHQLGVRRRLRSALAWEQVL